MKKENLLAVTAIESETTLRRSNSNRFGQENILSTLLTATIRQLIPHIHTTFIQPLRGQMHPMLLLFSRPTPIRLLNI